MMSLTRIFAINVISIMQGVAQKKRQFERLFASEYDFSQANFCARYLLKRGWHCRPWERRGTVYAQQTAFVTNLVVAYARPFTKSKGWPPFPSKLINFNTEQQDMHKRLMQLRHEIFAHSDSVHFSFWPVYMGSFRTTVEQVPFAVLSRDDAQLIIAMTDDLIRAASQKLKELHNELAENLADITSD